MAKCMDTQLQNFWKENISREAALRFSWHQRYSKMFSLGDESAAGTPFKPTAAAKPTRHSSVPDGKAVAERIRRLESEKRGRGTAATAKTSDGSDTTNSEESAGPDMRPPTAGTRTLLYNGISAHGDGRNAYLRKRKMLTPEEKYEFPILSSCQYGWKIREFGGQSKPSPHARVCVIKDSFYRNSGIIFG
jgi:hypothetical protein